MPLFCSDLVALHPEDNWGAGIVKQFALDMRNAFPGETGFSDTNVKNMRRWYEFYHQRVIIGQQAVDQLTMPEIFGMIPWGQVNVLYKFESKKLHIAAFFSTQTCIYGIRKWFYERKRSIKR